MDMVQNRSPCGMPRRRTFLHVAIEEEEEAESRPNVQERWSWWTMIKNRVLLFSWVFCFFTHYLFLQRFCVFPVGFPTCSRKMEAVNAIL